MYLTDFREEALVDVIESLDTELFERVTGLTLDDFHKLAEVGVFHPCTHMNEAIWQFRLIERASLDYLGTAPHAAPGGDVGTVGCQPSPQASPPTGHNARVPRFTVSSAGWSSS